MSNKESLGKQMGQEELAWDPYADLAELAAKELAAEGQLSAKPEEMIEDTRATQEALGVAALAGVLESGLAEEAKDETTEMVETDEPVGEVNTLITRACQAVGEKNFLEMTRNLDSLAAVNAPEVVMKYFRESPEAAMMDAGELWQAILAEDKWEKFGTLEEFAEKGKFYHTLNLVDLQKALKSGKVERTDKSGNSLKSDVELAADYCDENDEWHSGFVDAQGMKDDATVTLVLDGSLVKAEDFVTLGKLTVDEIDLKKYCLGIVGDFDSMAGRIANRMVRKSNLCEIPVYQESDVDGSGWRTKLYPAEDLRYYAEQRRGEMRHSEEDEEKVYNEVDREGLREQIEKFKRKMRRGGMEKMVLQYDGKLEGKKLREQLAFDLEKYYGEALGLEELPEIDWIYDLEATWNGKNHYGRNGEPSVVTLNWARLEDEGMRGVVRTLGHEMRHIYQRKLVEKWQRSPEELTDEDRELARLLELNFRDKKRRSDDPRGYREQIVEADAQTFAMACEGAYMRAHREVNRPINRMKRGAEAVKKGASAVKEGASRSMSAMRRSAEAVKKSAENLTYKGKRVAKKDAGKVKNEKK